MALGCLLLRKTSSTPAVVPGAAPALAKAGVGGFETINWRLGLYRGSDGEWSFGFHDDWEIDSESVFIHYTYLCISLKLCSASYGTPGIPNRNCVVYDPTRW